MPSIRNKLTHHSIIFNSVNAKHTGDSEGESDDDFEVIDTSPGEIYETELRKLDQDIAMYELIRFNFFYFTVIIVCSICSRLDP